MAPKSLFVVAALAAGLCLAAAVGTGATSQEWRPAEAAGSTSGAAAASVSAASRRLLAGPGAAAPAVEEEWQEGTATIAFSESMRPNDTQSLACQLAGISPYFTIHLAGIRLAAHPGACGRCVNLRCTDADRCDSLTRNVTGELTSLPNTLLQRCFGVGERGAS